MPKSLRLPTAALTTAAVLVAFTSQPSRAHDDDHHRLQGNKLSGKDPAGDADRRSFKFKTKEQIFINDSMMDEDPTLVPSSLIVRGTGVGDGDTGVIYLDPANWKQDGERGFTYRDDYRFASSSGIRKIKLRTGPKGGSLQVKAKGRFWSYSILGPQASVDLLLTIGSDVYCVLYDSLGDLSTNEAERVRGAFSDPPPDCVPVCGNGILELGEQCDDGNVIDDDTCNNLCEGCDPQQVQYDDTLQAIQEIIFDSGVYDCSNTICHGSAQAGGLDLRAGASHAQLVNVPSQIDPNTMRVFPGDQDLSLLYTKISNKTLGTPMIPGTPMPANNATVTEDHLEALRLWIRGGAPETGVVEGTAELLGTCLPSADPLKMPQPDPPAAGSGFQVAMPGWDLPQQYEDEICVPSYYDVDDLAIVPQQYRVNCLGLFPGTNDPPHGSGECLAFGENDLFQDPQSHHSIVHIYKGDYNYDDPGWGTWTCYLGANDGQACDPTDSGACPGGVCGGTTRSAVACLAFGTPFGPPDYGNFNNNAPTWSGAQESTAQFPLPDGVYTLLPLKGVIVWNSHAFNLTSSDMNMEGWINVLLTDDQQHIARALFEDDEIFVQNVPPFESREYCYTHTFQNNTQLFSLSSHMHKRGKRFRYYLPPQTPCGSASGCTPGNPGDLFYESFDYSDPLTIEFEPPMSFTGSTNNRTLKFCALYDNGENDPAEVKTRSGSPCPPPPLPCNATFGGPCAVNDSKCLGGPNQGQLCYGDDLNCPNSVCDACDLLGGVTTEDEMFIAIGQFYIP